MKGSWFRVGIPALLAVALLIGSVFSYPTENLTSKDFTAKELAQMSPEELAKLVPKEILEKYTPEQLSKLTPDELAHILPTKFPKPTTQWEEFGKGEVRFDPEEIPPDKVFIPRELTEEEKRRLLDTIKTGNAKQQKGAIKTLGTPAVVVYAPHPDDETYGLGGLLNHLDPRYLTIVVLFTKGENSAAYENGCYYLNTYPPDCTKYKDVWTRQQFADGRVEEYYDSLHQLGDGATGIDVQMVYNFGDGDLTVEEALGVMQQIESNYNVYYHYAPEYHETWHPDHRNAATALKLLTTSGFKRWYKVYTNGGDSSYTMTASDKDAKRSALNQYRYQENRRGIGYQSTPELWGDAYNGNREYWDIRF